MCCTEAIIRILVFVANIACLLVGVVLVALGVYHTVNFNSDYFEGIPDDYQVVRYIPTLAIILGVIIVVIAFMGCCGTLRSNTCMLSTYAICLIVIFLLQVALGIFGLVTIKDSSDFKSKINTTVDSLFRQYNQTNDVTGIVDLIQNNLECCGTSDSGFWARIDKEIPDSCLGSDHQVFDTGCTQSLYDLIMSSVKIIAVIAIVVSVIEIMGAVMAMYLNSRIKSKRGYA